MIQHNKWSLTELENMMPWEREVYVGLLIEHLEEEKREEAKQNNIPPIEPHHNCLSNFSEFPHDV